MQEKLHYTVENTLPAVAELIDNIRAEGFYTQLGERCQYLLALVLEELMTNIVKYGYDDSEQHWITIELSGNDDDLFVTLIDDGHPFDPFCDAKCASVTAELDERCIGGVGIHLVRTMSKNVSYKWENNHNVLAVTLDARQ